MIRIANAVNGLHVNPRHINAVYLVPVSRPVGSPACEIALVCSSGEIYYAHYATRAKAEIALGALVADLAAFSADPRAATARYGAAGTDA